MMSQETHFDRSAPVLHVSDMSRSLDYYRDIFGFKPGHLQHDPPVYATLRRDEVSLHLALDRTGKIAGTSSCCVFVKNVDALYKSCVENGVKIAREIEDSPYGLRDFNIEDPDGNIILFGE